MILVTGATGALGPSIIWGLYKNGFPSIKVFALDKPEPGILPEDIKLSIGNISNFDDLSRSMENIEAVIHMAAFLHINNPTKEQIYLYKKINVDGTKNVVRAALRAGAKKIIFFSTISVYGPSNGNIFNEDSDPNPLTPYAKSKLEAEQIILEAKLPNELPVGTVLRLAAAYGSRIKGNYLNLLRAIAKGWFVPVGQGRNRRTLIYDKDVAEAVVALLNSPSTKSRIFNVTDGNIYSVNEIVSAIYEALGRKPKEFYLPEKPLRWGLRIFEKSTNMLGLKSKIGEWIIDKYTEDIAVSGEKFMKETGFKPRYDLKTGWRETVEIMKARGLI